MYKIIIAILISCGLIGVWFFYSEIYTAEAQKAEKVEFIIEPGESVTALSERLEQNQIIRHAWIFRKYLALKNLDIKIRAGEFQVESPITLTRVAAALKNPSQSEREITIIPGWTLRDIATYFEKEEIATKKEFYDLLGEPAVNYKTVLGGPKVLFELEVFSDKPKYVSFEGYFAPDTFRVFADASLEEIIKKLMKHRDDQFTDQMYEDIKKSNRTVFEVITIASILEKEVRGLEDKKIVSDLFWRRYDSNWALQADSTVHYAVGTDGSVFTKKEDRESTSPWNTYKYLGLPIGPISNPSIESIMAAIYPEKNDYWYFLTTLDTGEVKYGKTLEQHNANVQKYLR